MIPKTFNNDGDGKKKDWREGYKQRLCALGKKAAAGRLSGGELRHRYGLLGGLGRSRSMAVCVCVCV